MADEAELIALRDRSAAQLAAIVHGGEADRRGRNAPSQEATAGPAEALADRLHKAREKAATEVSPGRSWRRWTKLGLAETVFQRGS